MKEIHISDIERLPEAAAQFIAGIVPGSVYAFRAPMGAGKTTFISEVCRQLDCSDEPNSPTFSIVNEYETQKWGTVYHADCYRLENEEEGLEIGLPDYFESGNTCFVEWPENVEGLLPEDTVNIIISVNADGSRNINIDTLD